MTAEILTIGTEILLGNIVNTNAAFLSTELAKLGISVYSHVSVGDNITRLKQAISAAFERCGLIVACGGLGPTTDDITKQAFADFFGEKLIVDEVSMELIRKRFKHITLPENVIRNALIIEGSQVLENKNGSAPGIFYEKNNKYIIMLPGPPHEMEPMFREFAVPVLKNLSDQSFYSKTFRIVGMGETAVEETILDLVEQANPTIGIYAKIGEVHVRVTASAKDEKTAKELASPLEGEISKRLGDKIFGVDEDTLPEVVVKLLTARKKTLALAESCTGGLIASEIVGIPGSSACLIESAVTYSNESKIKRLNILRETINIYGAVSNETCAEMAKGIRDTTGADIGLAITGIAGPGGGSETKPVGTVFIGVCYDSTVLVKQFHLIGNRNEIRIRATNFALNMVKKIVEQK